MRYASAQTDRQTFRHADGNNSHPTGGEVNIHRNSSIRFRTSVKVKSPATPIFDIATIKSKCLPILLYGTEACPVNSAVRHSLQFAVNRALFKIFGALSKDTYQDICKYFGLWTVEKQISARKSKFNLRYCASESAVCQTISKLR